MKQIIVLVATVILGLFIAGVVLDFQSPVQGIGTAGNTALNNLKNELTSAAAIV